MGIKNLTIIFLIVFCLVFISSFTKENLEPKKFVLKESETVVENKVLSEQTQLIQSMREEVDELYDTTYKLNRLLIKSHQGESDVRHTSTEPRANRSRDTHRGGNGFHLTATSER